MPRGKPLGGSSSFSSHLLARAFLLPLLLGSLCAQAVELFGGDGPASMGRTVIRPVARGSSSNKHLGVVGGDRRVTRRGADTAVLDARGSFSSASFQKEHSEKSSAPLSESRQDLEEPPNLSRGNPAGALAEVRAETKKPPERRKKKVAFAVFVTDVPDPTWADALSVLAFGFRKAQARSRHELELLALSPDTLSEDSEKTLRSAGFAKVLRRPIPVRSVEIRGEGARHEMEKVQGNGGPHFALEAEQVKYYGLTLEEYDRVLVLDADTMILDPMDELMELEDRDFVGTYDWGLDSSGGRKLPVQGGFLLFKPNATDFHEILEITREGDFTGAGWKGSGFGYCYGGVGPTGLLSYLYHKDALMEREASGSADRGVIAFTEEGLKSLETKSFDNDEELESSSDPGGESKVKPEEKKPIAPRMLAVDREIYDVVIGKHLMSHLGEDVDHERVAKGVKSAHFTGDCLKPWNCQHSRENWLCNALTDSWWELRAGLEAEQGLPKTERCPNKSYALMAKTETPKRNQNQLQNRMSAEAEKSALLQLAIGWS